MIKRKLGQEVMGSLARSGEDLIYREGTEGILVIFRRLRAFSVLFFIFKIFNLGRSSPMKDEEARGGGTQGRWR